MIPVESVASDCQPPSTRTQNDELDVNSQNYFFDRTGCRHFPRELVSATDCANALGDEYQAAVESGQTTSTVVNCLLAGTNMPFSLTLEGARPTKPQSTVKYTFTPIISSAHPVSLLPVMSELG